MEVQKRYQMFRLKAKFTPRLIAGEGLNSATLRMYRMIYTKNEMVMHECMLELL